MSDPAHEPLFSKTTGAAYPDHCVGYEQASGLPVRSRIEQPALLSQRDLSQRPVRSRVGVELFDLNDVAHRERYRAILQAHFDQRLVIFGRREFPGDPARVVLEWREEYIDADYPVSRYDPTAYTRR